MTGLASCGALEVIIRILIVEDDNQLGDALANGIRQLGHVVEWFRTGKEADAALATTAFDAIVLDLGLPGGDGLTWLIRWRARRIGQPVLILTARDGVPERVAGLDAGADDYLIKPITIDELAAQLAGETGENPYIFHGSSPGCSLFGSLRLRGKKEGIANVWKVAE